MFSRTRQPEARTRLPGSLLGQAMSIRLQRLGALRLHGAASRGLS